MFPILLAHSGQACFACNSIHPISKHQYVVACRGCETAIFCNADCRNRAKQHHQAVCRCIQAVLEHPLFIPLRHIPPTTDSTEIAHRRDLWWTRLQLARRLTDLHLTTHLSEEGTAAGNQLPLAVGNRFSYEPYCRVCFATVRQLDNTASPAIKPCCHKCHMLFSCSFHVEEALALHKKDDECRSYCAMHVMQHFIRTHKDRFGDEFSFVPDPQVVGSRPETDSWDSYFAWRVPPEMKAMIQESISCFFQAATTHLSIQLTTLLAMRKFGIEMSDYSSLSIHVIGASSYDGFPTQAWEEIMHQIPSIQTLNVVMVGPEMNTIMGESARDKDLEPGVYPECASRGRRRVFRIIGELYHEFADQEVYRKPDIAMAFNTGIADDDFKEDWRPTVQYLIDENIPVCYTAWTKGEAVADQKFIQSLGGKFVKEFSVNPFASLEPTPDPDVRETERFFYLNRCYMLVQGHGR